MYLNLFVTYVLDSYTNAALGISVTEVHRPFEPLLLLTSCTSSFAPSANSFRFAQSLPGCCEHWNPQLVARHEKELALGNRNRATLAIARKLVEYLLAVDRRGTPFVAEAPPRVA